MELEADIHYWTGRATGKDPAGWYISWRDHVGNIIDVSGPYATRDGAEHAEFTDSNTVTR